MAHPNARLLSVLLIATISIVALAEDCVYKINVQTGKNFDAGTDAVIGVILADKSGSYIEIKDLESWGGKMPAGHDYFENGDLDFFIGTARCLPSPLCFLTLTSDGSSDKPGWYVEYVDVNTAKKGSPSKGVHFIIEQWLAMDKSPHELSTERNHCPESFGSEIRKSLYSIV